MRAFTRVRALAASGVLSLLIVPLGGGVGKIFHIGKLPVNTQLSAYYNVVHPDDGANWQLRLQVQFLFPK
ncbi:MAG: hypothetical protein JNL68_01065 [Burkholderiales bacterium]|nr:hypothetical protein [Burkholderiales bacterium]